MPLRTSNVENPSHLWGLVTKVGLIVSFLILVVVLVIPLRPRLAQYEELKDEGKILEARRSALQREIERHEAELQMLERDPLFVEVKARDTLDMCKPGEVIFRFEDNRE